jgi:hypothetical protein
MRKTTYELCEKCGRSVCSNQLNKHRKFCDGNSIPKKKRAKYPLNGRKVWNEGFTKENCEEIKKSSEKIRNNFEKGELIPSFLGKKHSEETRKKWKENPNMGGLRKGSGRGKKGWYKGFYCRSTWELAWLVYQLDKEIKVEHCHDTFEYEFEGEKHKYYPDFIVDGSYIEIKGFRYPNTQSKIDQFPSDKKLVLIEGKKEIKPYLNHVEEKYGKEFWNKLYECGSAVDGSRAD